jgi:regulator of cell morphogenesis and NO signaling
MMYLLHRNKIKVGYNPTNTNKEDNKMEMIFDRTSKIGDIVARVPKTSNVLKGYRIDFCCGGNRPISEAIEAHNLIEEEVLQKLNAVYHEVKDAQAETKDWEKESYSELIDHVVNTHHAYLNTELPIISEFVTKILRVHGLNHTELSRVHRLFHQLKAEMEHHSIKEEMDAFPLIKDYEKEPKEEKLPLLGQVITALENEHDGAGDILKEIRQITNDFELPEDACTTYRLTFQKLEELESDLFQHIHLENNILFPRVLKEAANA